MARKKGNELPNYDERDGPRYMTVQRPYPMNANMDIEADRMAFAYWIASCIGRENLLAFFHKPKSPSMVIIEINRSFEDHKVILGLHRWSKILRKPTGEEKKMDSRIFHCTYQTMREVEKYGWKRIDLQEEWFVSNGRIVKWHRINDVITDPYPDTEPCDPPYEDPTRERLCRPLPTKDFAPPPTTRPPPVGSSEWLKVKEAGAQANRVTTPRTPQPEYPVSAGPAGSRRNLTGWAQDRSSPLGQGSLPPGLVPRGPTAAQPSKWSMGPPGLVRDLSGASSRSNGSDSGGSSAHPPTPQDDAQRSFSVSMSALADDEDEDEDDVEFVGVPTVGNVVEFVGQTDHLEEAKAEEESDWASVKPPKKAGPVFKCPWHPNKRCKPAICQAHKDWAYAQKCAEKQEASRQAKANASKKGKGRRTESTGSWRVAPETNRGLDEPPHLSPQRSSSRSSASSDGRSSSESSERSEPAPAHTKNRPHKERPKAAKAGPRPAHLSKGTLSVAKSKPASPAPNSAATNSQSGGMNGEDGSAKPSASAPTTPWLRKELKGSTAAGSATAPAPPPNLRKGNRAAGAGADVDSSGSTPVPDTLSANVGQWLNDVVSGRAPSEYGGDDDAQSVAGWSTASLGEDQWGSAEDNGTGKKRGVPAGGNEPSDRAVNDDTMSVAGWSTALLGEDQWGSANVHNGKAKHNGAPTGNAWSASRTSANARSVTGWGIAVDNGTGKGNGARVGGNAPPDKDINADARSVTGWSTASLGEDQWGSVGIDHKKVQRNGAPAGNAPFASRANAGAQSATGGNTASLGKNRWGNAGANSWKVKSNGAPANNTPAVSGADADARSVAGWSSASLGEDQWGKVETDKDDDADSDASTVAPDKPKKTSTTTAAASAGNGNGKGKGKGKNKKNKNKTQAQDQAQNGGAGKAAAAEDRAPVVKLPAAPAGKMSWADQVQFEEDNRSVASSGKWGAVSDGPW